MARDFLQDKARSKVAESVEGSLSQLANAATQIKAVAPQLTAARAKMAAGVSASDFDQADVDKLDSLTTKVAALAKAADDFLK